jgi:O-antigen/teichoic acid export membrane protein
MWNELKALLKHTSVYGAGNLLNKLAGFLLIPFYTHYLAPADYGTLELLDLSASLLGLAVMMWMNAAVIRYYYEYEDQKNRNEVVSTALIVASIVGILSAIGGIAFSRQLSALILKSSSSYRYFWPLSITFFFSTLNSVSFSFLRAKQRSTLVTALSVGSMVLSLSLNIYFIAILKTGVIGILYSGLISTALMAITLTAATVREVKLSFSFEKLKALAIYGAPLVITSFSAFALNFSDRFFLQHFTNVSIVGIYALGYKFGFMLSFLIGQPFHMIWSSRMYEIAKKQDAPALFSRLFRYYGLVLVTVALGLSLIIKDLIRLVAAPAFRDAYKIVPVIALAYVFEGAFRFLVSGLYIEKKTHYLGVISSISLAANLLLNFILIPTYGAMGAAWATALSFLLMAGLGYLVSQRFYATSYQLGAFVVPIAIAAALYSITARLSVSSLVFSAALRILVLLSFPIALFLVGFFKKDELRKLRETGHALWTTYGWGSTAVSER